MLALKYKWLSGLYGIFALIYIAQAVLLPPDKAAMAKYHISAGQLKLLGLTVVIPYLVIWLIALGGYLRLRDYTEAIQGSKDGKAFTTIASGILLLTLWLPLSAILSGLLTHYYRSHPEMTAHAVWVDNYTNLLILFVAFWLVNQGAQQLLKLVNQSVRQFPQRITMLFIGLSAFYVFLTLQDPARRVATKTITTAAYYLPDWAIVTTIVIPRLIMWFLGIQAVYFIYLYRQKVKGALYKDALQSLAHGLAWVISMIIILRLFQSVNTQLSGLSLGIILLIVYGLLVLIATGYGLIAKGAKNLQRIEEL